ncbi:MAG: argininosuccinate lyase, partial [Thermoanaerobaculia bacterium]
MTKLWGGRFTEEPSELLRALNDSFGFDRALFEQDVQGSVAWTEALARASVLTPDEAARMTSALRAVAPPSDSDVAQHEDVHSYVESK